MFFPPQIALDREVPLTDALALVDPAADRRWVLEGDGTGTDFHSANVAATVTGDAVQLLLLMWKLVDLADSAVQVEGDLDAARRVLSARLTP